MSITQKMIRDSCRSTWGADWWKTDKLSRKATATLSLSGINYEPILAIEDEAPVHQVFVGTEICPICQDLVENSQTTTTECNHTFHSNCYTNWICSQMRTRAYGKITCPCCRADICDIR